MKDLENESNGLEWATRKGIGGWKTQKMNQIAWSEEQEKEEVDRQMEKEAHGWKELQKGLVWFFE